METRRIVPREREVRFEFRDGSANPVVVNARDASLRSARFDSAGASSIPDAAAASFDLAGRRMHADRFEWMATPRERDDVCLIQYVARPEQPRDAFARLRMRLARIVPSRRRGPRPLYRRTHPLRRVIGRVSRIHLYEAQEHFVYLSGLVERHVVTGQHDPNTWACIRLCRRRLDRASVLLSRLQQDLNFLWREMAQVYNMLLAKVVPDEYLGVHLDYCTEEAKRLALDKDPEVTQMLRQVAELKDSNRQDLGEMRRLLRALVERFTRVRTGRIHDQFVNISSYRKAILLLAPVAFLMLVNPDLFVEGQAPISWPAYPEEGFAPAYVLTLARSFLAENIIAFVFFAGLLGGFISVAIRLRSRELVPGEDAYFAWYVLTKPWVGAIGAAVLFVLIQAGFVSMALGSSDLKEVLTPDPGAVVFGFGFVAGFSERLIFPRLGEGGGKSS